jgi:hypothetical protein
MDGSVRGAGAPVIQSATRKIVKRTSIQPGAPPSFLNAEEP